MIGGFSSGAICLLSSSLGNPVKRTEPDRTAGVIARPIAAGTTAVRMRYRPTQEFVIGGRAMIGWRARLGFLVPPGNPTVEREMIALAPRGVTVHFHRMVARGEPGAPDGQDERNRMMIDN